jgi:FAD/FMN-containing dehydrogenase
MVAELRGRLRGSVVTAADDGYDEARRVYNGTVDRRPRFVARCVDRADVRATVDYCRSAGVEISVRGGGHSAPGYGTNDGGAVIDLSAMRGVRVDPGSGTARVAGGCTWDDINRATYPFGLATTGGIVSTTGVGGLTLGGGVGYLARLCGLTVDNVVSADVVTADGRFVVASAHDNEDLFWALRGGGGNFGVVTAFEFRLHEVRDVVVGMWFYPSDRARDVIEFYDHYVSSAPDPLGGFVGFHVAPPLPFIPPVEHGKTFCVVLACWAGPAAAAEAVFAPLSSVAPRVAEHLTVMPYPEVNRLFDDLLGPGLQHYWKSVFTTRLSGGAVAAHLAHGPNVPAMSSAVHLYPTSGAAGRVDAAATAYSHRDARFITVIAGMWPDPADSAANIDWVRGYYDALAPHSSTAGYINFMSADDQARVRDNHGANYDRLRAVKRAYDPDNVFRHNHNITPS